MRIYSRAKVLGANFYDHVPDKAKLSKYIPSWGMFSIMVISEENVISELSSNPMFHFALMPLGKA